MLKISTQLLVDEALRRGWKAEPLDDTFLSTVAITPKDGRVYYFESIQPPLTSAAAMKIADNKLATYLIAQKLGIPVAEFTMYNPAAQNRTYDFLEAHRKNGHQIVVKPIDTNHGDGITVGVKNREELEDALVFAKKHSSQILLQRRYYGYDYRVIVVDGKVVAAAKRTPAHVVGDGEHTVSQLITIENQRPERGKGHDSALSVIDTLGAQRFLGRAAFERVPQKGEDVSVLGMANLSRGGDATDVTDDIHESFKNAAVKIASSLDMLVCGVDFLVQDHKSLFDASNGILLEINATPGVRMHHYPSYGKKRDVVKTILDAFEAKIAG